MGMELSLLEAVESVNERQKRVLFGKLSQRLGQNLRGSQVAAWGLSFKAETDDMRESPALSLIDAILEAGASVRAHDPKAMEAAREVYGSGLYYARDPYDAGRRRRPGDRDRVAGLPQSRLRSHALGAQDALVLTAAICMIPTG